ncbi:MAG: hypothetical protein BWY67_01394 [Bacteroidetes bacterium ADurb.Bin397]|jgi:hypothetical protein|nr:MAG: hypothetical protein BWY67_01394 [Bacteroidetes bacterium ADurb.Bin397]
MKKTTRNNIVGYLLFLYGTFLNFLLVINLESEGEGFAIALNLILGSAAALFAALFFGYLKIRMHFYPRNALLFLLLTVAEIAIWYLICEGTFQLKN